MYTRGGYWKCVCVYRFLQIWTYWQFHDGHQSKVGMTEEMWNSSKARHDPTRDPKKCNKNWNTPRNGSLWICFIVYICDVHSNSLLWEMNHFYWSYSNALNSLRWRAPIELFRLFRGLGKWPDVVSAHDFTSIDRNLMHPLGSQQGLNDTPHLEALDPTWNIPYRNRGIWATLTQQQTAQR